MNMAWVFALLSLVLQSALLWTLGDSLTPAIAALAAGAALLTKSPPREWLASWWQLAAWAAVPASLLGLIIEGGSTGPTSIMPVWLSLALARWAVVLQALALSSVRHRGGQPDGVAICAAIVGLCYLNLVIDEKTRDDWGTMTTVVGVSMVWSMVASGSGETLASRQWTSKIGAVATVIVFTACGGWALANAWESTVTSLHVVIPGWMTEASANKQKSRGYVRSGTLSSVTTYKQVAPMQVALRVFSERVPGYLRGRVFDTFEDSRWSSSQRRREWGRWNDRGLVQPAISYPSIAETDQVAGAVFAIGDPPMSEDEPLRRIEVHNDPERDAMFFTPLGTHFLKGAADALLVDEHHVVRHGFDIRQPYVAFASRTAESNAPDMLQRNRLLQIPTNLDPEMARLAREVCQGTRTTGQKISAVTRYFRENFVYAREDVEFPADVDPLTWFTLNRAPGQCELFASAAIILLRLEGVPCRYVTGYVATELEGDRGEYWIARNHNAHAWCEAFDEGLKRWVVVEATPGLPGETDESASTAGRRSATLFDDTDNEFSDDNMATWLWRWISLKWLSMSRWLAVPMSIGVLAALVVGAFFLRRPRSNGRESAVSRELGRIERRLRRRKLVRRSSETLHQFAARIVMAAGHDPVVREAAELLRSYAINRYAAKIAPTSSRKANC
jgi:transglutaminase-like putative cysteine protease